MAQSLAGKAAYRMARYALHRLRRQCVRCPATSDRFALCLACRQRDSQNTKERRALRKAA